MQMLHSVFVFWTEKKYYFEGSGKNLSETYFSSLFFYTFSVQNPGGGLTGKVE